MTASIMIWLVRILTGVLVIVTVLPFIQSGYWVVRLADFPRLHLAVLAAFGLVMLAVAIAMDHRRVEHLVIGALLVSAGIWQASHVLPFTLLWKAEVRSADSGSAENAIRLLVANVRYENDRYAETSEMIRSIDPDLLLLIENTEEWDRGLAGLHDQMPHRVGVTREDGLGIALWSKLLIVEHEIRHLVTDDRASVFATVELPDGRRMEFVGVHPTPPGLEEEDGDGRHGSRIRDAELLLVAEIIRKDPDRPWIVAGDFNDVAWSHTTRLFKRLSGLRDPRIGRSLLNTFDADWVLARFPIDHVFMSDGFVIHTIDRARTPGSDHFAVRAEIELIAEVGSKPEATAEDHEEAKELIEEGQDESAEEGGQTAPV